MQPATFVAADRQLRPIDGQLLQPQIQEWHGRPRHNEIDAREVEDGLAGRMVAVMDLQSANGQARIPSLPAGIDGRYHHGLPQFVRQRRHDAIAIVVDPRKHDKADDQQQHAKKRERRDRSGTQNAENPGGARVGQIGTGEGVTATGIMCSR